MILLLRCCLSKVGWFRETRRFAPTLLILRRAVLSAFYPVFKEPGRSCDPRPCDPAFPHRAGALTAVSVVVRGTLQSYAGCPFLSTSSTLILWAFLRQHSTKSTRICRIRL